jgi:hypothetical protein
MIVLYELAAPGEGVLDIHDQLGEATRPLSSIARAPFRPHVGRR